ncbi:hypothetical protein OIM90_32340 [Streptomyces sp. AD16]|nr:hypothetical protein OIM90_32340 [Streptomyces sp. AD16]
MIGLFINTVPVQISEMTIRLKADQKRTEKLKGLGAANITYCCQAIHRVKAQTGILVFEVSGEQELKAEQQGNTKTFSSAWKTGAN